MRILHISRTMGQGGAEKIVYQLCMDNKEDYQVVISDGGQYVDKLAESGIKHYMMPDIDSKHPFNMLRAFYCIWNTTKREKIDILHSHHRMAAFYAKIISKLTNVKTVYTAHNVFNNKVALTHFSLSGTNIIAVGDGVRKNLIDFFKLDSRYISTIYNSIKISLKGAGVPELEVLKRKGKFLVGTIGRITEQKGIDIFIKSIGQAIEENNNLVGIIIGDGEDRSKMELMVKAMNLEENIIFLGYRDNVLDIIKQLDFVVLASRWEGLPLTPIEAFSQGKTVIASDIPGNNEVVEDKKTGLLFEKDNIKELAKRIILLSSNSTLLNRLQQSAYHVYLNKYKYDIFIEAYKNIYKII